MSLNVLMFLAVGLLMPPLATTLGIGLGQAMVFVSINMVAGAVTLAVAGPYLIRRLGTRRLAVIGSVFSGAMIYLVSLVTNVVALYGLAFASGVLATTAMQLTGAALVNDWFLQRRGLMQGVLMGIAELGGIAAGAVLPTVVGAGGWQLGFQTVGAATVAVGLFAGVVLIRSHPADVGLHVYGSHDTFEDEHKDDSGLDPAVASRSPQFAALMVALVSFSAIMALQQHFPAMMADRGLDLAAAGTLLSLLSVACVAATLVLGALSDRRGPLFAYVTACGLLVPALGMFLLTSGYAAQAAGVVLFAIPAITPPILTPILLRRAFGGRAFLPLLGVATATMPAGIAIGSPLWGLSKDATGGYDLALVVAILLTVLIAVLVSYSVASGSRRWPGQMPDRDQRPAT